MEPLSIIATESPINTFFFPLRTNVQYFDSTQTRLLLEARIKQASVLYESILFEAGMYHATVWEREGGGPIVDMWLPPESLDLDSLQNDDDSFRPTGGAPQLLIDGHVFGSGPAERQFRSQFHGFLRKAGAENLPWIRTESFGLPSAVDNFVKELGRRDEQLIGSLIPEASRFLKAKIAYNLNRDLFLAAELGVAASLDDLFAPLVEQKAQRVRGIEPALGFSALRVAVPNWSALSWEEVVELRQHPSVIEFRKKMVAVERVAREATSKSEVSDLQFQLAQIITAEISDELFNLRGTATGLAGEIALDIIAGPIPGASAVLTAAKGVARLSAQNQSWTTAFFKLRKRL